MLESVLEYNRANQAVVITPFLLMGAMSPVSIPATLVAADRRGARRASPSRSSSRPGCPVIFGSFLSNTDMQSGSPSFGTPESAIGLLCTGQIARRFGLPFRSRRRADVEPDVDAQAAYESLMTMLPTFLAGTNFVMHSAGWLEGGPRLLLREVHRRHRAAADAQARVQAARDHEESLAFDAHAGGRLRRALPRRRAHAAALPRVLLPAAAVLDGELRPLDNERRAGRDRPRAARSGARRSTSTSSPPIDEGVRDELRDYVARRRIELGDEPIADAGVLTVEEHPDFLWRTPEPRAAYEVVIVGGGGHGLATAYYLAKRARDHRRRRARARLARRRQHGPQHDDHPLELPLGRERGDLRALAQAVGGAGGGARLRPAVQPARRPQPRAQPAATCARACGA